MEISKSTIETDIAELLWQARHLKGEENPPPLHEYDLERLLLCIQRMAAELTELKAAHLREWDAFYQRNGGSRSPLPHP